MTRSLNGIKGVLCSPGALPSVALWLAVTATASPYLWVQNGKTQTSTAQATLRLTVRVVPVAMLSAFPRSESDSTASVAYHLPAPPSRMAVTEEIRPFPAGLHSRLRAQHQLEPAVLKTLIVVAR